MKRVLLCGLMMFLPELSMARTEQLLDFDQLMHALKHGEQVRVVVHYGRCNLEIDGEEIEAPDAVGGMSIDVFESFAKGSIGNDKACVVFSHASLIHRRQYVHNYVKFRVYEDNTLEIRAQYLKARKYKQIMDETFRTTINDGEKEGAACFYRVE